MTDKNRIVSYVTDETYNMLKSLSEKNERTVSVTISQILVEYFKSKKDL